MYESISFRMQSKSIFRASINRSIDFGNPNLFSIVLTSDGFSNLDPNPDSRFSDCLDLELLLNIH